MIGRLTRSLFKNPAAAAVSESYQETVEADEARTAGSLDELRTTVRRAGGRLPVLVFSQLRQLDDLLRTVLDAASTQTASTEQHVLLHALVSDYIPTPLRAFLELPDVDRADDSPATGSLAAQLSLLEGTVRDLLNQVRTGAIEELSTHGRFLADKFAAPSLRLDGP